jgi:hypothetical protein
MSDGIERITEIRTRRGDDVTAAVDAAIVSKKR